MVPLALNIALVSMCFPPFCRCVAFLCCVGACASGLVRHVERHAPLLASRRKPRPNFKLLLSLLAPPPVPLCLCVDGCRTTTTVPVKRRSACHAWRMTCACGARLSSFLSLHPASRHPKLKLKLPTITPNTQAGGGGDDGHRNISQAEPRENAGATGGAVDRVGSGDFGHLGNRMARRRTMAAIRGQQQQYQWQEQQRRGLPQRFALAVVFAVVPDHGNLPRALVRHGGDFDGGSSRGRAGGDGRTRHSLAHAGQLPTQPASFHLGLGLGL